MDTNEVLRRDKICARESLTDAERRERSAAIVERILSLREFKTAETVMIYRAVRGEVSLEGLRGAGKRFAYPLCASAGVMEALCPGGADAWRRGSFNIPEPVRERSLLVAPEEIDLVLCPCTVFDESCGRLGMGGGYYDRFLPKCAGAVIAAVAFEVQKAESLRPEKWDVPMDVVLTEKGIYRRK